MVKLLHLRFSFLRPSISYNEWETQVRIALLPLAAALVAASPPGPLDMLQQGAADVGAAIKTPLTIVVDTCFDPRGR
jgi:hypothetical protein